MLYFWPSVKLALGLKSQLLFRASLWDLASSDWVAHSYVRMYVFSQLVQYTTIHTHTIVYIHMRTNSTHRDRAYLAQHSYSRLGRQAGHVLWQRRSLPRRSSVPRSSVLPLAGTPSSLCLQRGRTCVQQFTVLQQINSTVTDRDLTCLALSRDRGQERLRVKS